MRYDFITIGSATLDVFVGTDEANIVSVTNINRKLDFMSFPYGSKLDINEFSFDIGGGAVNTACNFANLGYKTSTIVKLGHDFQSKTIFKHIENKNIDTANIIKTENEISGFSIILTSFQGDRTVLTHRGTNATIKECEIDFDAIKNSKWLYIAPLSGQSAAILDDLSVYACKNNVNVAVNLGTTSIKKCAKHLNKTLEIAKILVMNLEEAIMLTKIDVKPDNLNETYSNQLIHPDIRKIFKTLFKCNGQIIIITDGKNGAYCYDGETFYKCENFESNIVSTLGAGDAFASTFVAAYSQWNDIKKALKYAAVNASSVIEYFGATCGLLNFGEIEEKLKQKPDFRVLSLQ